MPVGPDISSARGQVRRKRKVTSQGLGSISVLKPSQTSDEEYPIRQAESDYLELHALRAELIGLDPDYAKKVLPSLSKHDRAIQYMIPRLKFWEEDTPEAYELLMYQTGTDSQLSLAAKLSKDMMVNAQSSELLNSLRLRKPNQPYPKLQLGLLEDLYEGQYNPRDRSTIDN